MLDLADLAIVAVTLYLAWGVLVNGIAFRLATRRIKRDGGTGLPLSALTWQDIVWWWV